MDQTLIGQADLFTAREQVIGPRQDRLLELSAGGQGLHLIEHAAQIFKDIGSELVLLLEIFNNGHRLFAGQFGNIRHKGHISGLLAGQGPRGLFGGFPGGLALFGQFAYGGGDGVVGFGQRFSHQIHQFFTALAAQLLGQLRGH